MWQVGCCESVGVSAVYCCVTSPLNRWSGHTLQSLPLQPWSSASIFSSSVYIEESISEASHITRISGQNGNECVQNCRRCVSLRCHWHNFSEDHHIQVVQGNIGENSDSLPTGVPHKIHWSLLQLHLPLQHCHQDLLHSQQPHQHLLSPHQVQGNHQQWSGQLQNRVSHHPSSNPVSSIQSWVCCVGNSVDIFR